jgi:hypothetical protein
MGEIQLQGVTPGTVAVLLEDNLWRLEHPARTPIYVDRGTRCSGMWSSPMSISNRPRCHA